MAVTTAQVQELYVAYLGRAADKAGLDYWMAELNAEPAVLTLENLRANFVTEQQEYADIYGGLSREETVIQIYNNLFGRAPDAAGLSYWTTGEGAGVNADQLLVAFINGASASDAQVVANKALVANIYTQVAGSNFSLADAAAAIAGVNATATSVSEAIGNLTALPSVALPEAVALVQAAAVTAKAVADFESKANTDKLVALNEKVAALNIASKAGADIVDLDADDDDAVSFDEALATLVNATELREALGDATSVLATKAELAASELAAARTALVNGVTGALTAVRAFEGAVAKNAALVAADTDLVNLRTAQLQAASTTKAWADAVEKVAALESDIDTGEAGVSAADLFAFLADAETTAAQVNAVTSAFSAVEGFSAVAALAAQDQAKAKAMLAESDAKDAVAKLVEGNVYLAKFEANVDAKQTLADAKAADVLLSDIKAIVASYESLTNAADKAAEALFKATSAVAIENNIGDNTKAEVFFFGSKDDAATTFVKQVSGLDDLKVSVSTGDSIFVGSGWTLNGSATLKDGVITGAHNGVKEIFLLQDTNGIHAVIETADYGSAAGINTGVGPDTNANVAVITLTGVESLDQVSFANGMITIA